MKKFFILCFSFIFLCFSTISLSGCSKNELDKISSGLSNYAISATLNDDEKTINATEKVTYFNKCDFELEYICLHLYPRAFREGALVKSYTSLTLASCFPNGINYGDISIVKVKVNGEVKPFELVGDDEDILKINLGFKLTKNASVEIEIEFILTIPNCTHRFGWYESNINLGNWYPIVAEMENGQFDMSPYYATGDPFFSSVANYEVEMTLPSSYSICSTGEKELVDTGEENTFLIKAKAVRDFAMCLSKNSNITNKKIGKTEIIYMADNINLNTEKYLAISAQAVNFFSDTFGTYPYSTLSVVKTPFIYGGMEYPNLVLISNSIDDEDEYLKVIVHEIAHQWWYGIVGNNEIKDAWLDESLSEYSTALFFKNHDEYEISYNDIVESAVSSYMLYVDVIQTLNGEVNTKMNIPINEYKNDYEYSYMVYVKGVIMFDSLKNMVGEKKVILGLKQYFDDNKYKIAKTSDFFDAFNKACHKDLKQFFDGYLNGTTIISSIN